MENESRDAEHLASEERLHPAPSNGCCPSPQPLSYDAQNTVAENSGRRAEGLAKNAYRHINKDEESRRGRQPFGPTIAASDAKVRATLGDMNRKFLLLSLTFPAVLGTIIWESLGAPFSSLLAWAIACLVVAHFAFDFLYLKINLDYYGAEDEFKYGWLLFLIDMAIVALLRTAFVSSHSLPLPKGFLFQPYGIFTAIYGLYVLWECVYCALNRGCKRSSQSTVREYAICLVLFSICWALHSLNLVVKGSACLVWSCNSLFLMTMMYTTYRHYVSVFVQVRQR